MQHNKGPEGKGVAGVACTYVLKPQENRKRLLGKQANIACIHTQLKGTWKTTGYVYEIKAIRLHIGTHPS